MTSQKKLRMWLLIGFAPVALAGLLIVVKILSMYAFAHSAISSHVRGNPAGTVSASEGLETANWFEQYKAPYNLGVGLATLDRLDEARAKFEEALPLASGLEACPIQINLALVVEMMGDQARTENPQAAPELYAEALELSLDTPEECRSEEADRQSPDPERSNEDTLDEQQERLKQKQQEQGGEPNEEQEQDDSQSEEEQQEQQENLDEIEDKLKNGAEERENGGSGEEEGEGGYGSDKPW